MNDRVRHWSIDDDTMRFAEEILGESFPTPSADNSGGLNRCTNAASLAREKRHALGNDIDDVILFFYETVNNERSSRTQQMRVCIETARKEHDIDATDRVVKIDEHHAVSLFCARKFRGDHPASDAHAAADEAFEVGRFYCPTQFLLEMRQNMRAYRIAECFHLDLRYLFRRVVPESLQIRLEAGEIELQRSGG